MVVAAAVLRAVALPVVASAPCPVLHTLVDTPCSVAVVALDTGRGRDQVLCHTRKVVSAARRSVVGRAVPPRPDLFHHPIGVVVAGQSAGRARGVRSGCPAHSGLGPDDALVAAWAVALPPGPRLSLFVQADSAEVSC